MRYHVCDRDDQITRQKAADNSRRVVDQVGKCVDRHLGPDGLGLLDVNPSPAKTRTKESQKNGSTTCSLSVSGSVRGNTLKPSRCEHRLPLHSRRALSCQLSQRQQHPSRASNYPRQHRQLHYHGTVTAPTSLDMSQSKHNDAKTTNPI